MRSPADKRTRLWPLRLLQASPLIVFAVAFAVWFALPLEMRSVALQMGLPGNAFETSMPPELVALQALDSALQRESGRATEGQTDPIYPLKTIADGATGRLMAQAWRLYDASGTPKPYPISADDAAFNSLAVYEKSSGARVAIYLMPPQRNPPVALSAVTSLNGLNPAERREYETLGTLESLRRFAHRGMSGAWVPNRSSAGALAAPPLQVDVENLTSERGTNDARRSVAYATRAIGDRLYEVYSVELISKPGDNPLGAPVLPDTTAVDTPTNRRAIERLSKLSGGAVFVIGPTDGELVPLRSPGGLPMSPAAAEAIASEAATQGYGQGVGVRRTDPAIAKLPGTGDWTGTVLSTTPGFLSTSPDGRSGAIAPLVYVAYWDTHPEIAQTCTRIGRTPLRELQVGLAARAPFIFGVLGACFLASLISAPLAFARERRLTAERELERERERVRREARERVLGRLTELSRRIDEAALGTLSGETSAQIESAARDIDDTVGELKRILGGLGADGGTSNV